MTLRLGATALLAAEQACVNAIIVVVAFAWHTRLVAFEGFTTSALLGHHVVYGLAILLSFGDERVGELCR